MPIKTSLKELKAPISPWPQDSFIGETLNRPHIWKSAWRHMGVTGTQYTHLLEKRESSEVWWRMSAIPTLGRLRDKEFEASLHLYSELKVGLHEMLTPKTNK